MAPVFVRAGAGCRVRISYPFLAHDGHTACACSVDTRGRRDAGRGRAKRRGKTHASEQKGGQRGRWPRQRQRRPFPPSPPHHTSSYVNTAACISSISYIDGDAGILRYRGYPIEQLAQHCTFPEVAHLVVYGRLPTGGELTGWEDALARHSALPPPVVGAVSALPHDAHFMGTVLTGE